MAEVLSKYEFADRSPKYPWHEWMDGRVWKLRPKDFFNNQRACAVAAHLYAIRHGGHVRTGTTKDGELVLQFIKGPGPRARKNGK